MSAKVNGKQVLRRIILVVALVAIMAGTFIASSLISSHVRDVNSAKEQVRSDLLEAVNAIETSTKNSNQFLLVAAAADFSAQQQQSLITTTNTVLVSVKNNRALDLVYVTRGSKPKLVGDGSVGKSAGYQLTAVGIAEPIKGWSYTYDSATKAYSETSLNPQDLANGKVNAQGANLTVTTKQLSKVTTFTAEASGLLAPQQRISFPGSNLNKLTYAKYQSQSAKLTKFELPASTVEFISPSGETIELPQGLKWNLTFVTTSAPQLSRVQLMAQTTAEVSQQTLQALSTSQAKIKAAGFEATFDFPLGVNVVNVAS